jgi:hypothetical protein
MAKLRRLLWWLRWRLGLSPTQQLFRELRRRGVVPERLQTLEMFGGAGRVHTRDYADKVASLDVWEIDPVHAASLRRILPGANVHITDSYQEMTRAARRYDMIVMDSPEGEHSGHYEHFDLFPGVLRLANDTALLILNIRPGTSNTPADRFDDVHLAQRRAFYHTEHPQQMPVAEMIPVYRAMLGGAGFNLEWHVSRPRTRSGRVHYLALKIKRNLV